MSSADLDNVGPNSWRSDTSTLDIELTRLDIEPPRPREENPLVTDHYEILRIAPQADDDTIERVYRTLADRFHPDNPRTGHPETFLRLREAYATLTNQSERAKYNELRQYSRASSRFRLTGREFFDGVRGGQNRRLAVLCLLYRQRITSHEFPGLTVLDLEQLTGCTREEVTSALWYLCEKQWATIGEFTAYSITAAGFGFVESKLEDRLEFRSLATMCYYPMSSERENEAQGEHFSSDSLPLDIEPAITSEGNLFIADHYEILGIGPRSDEDSIERVYRTMASRFHPDNPSTGDARTFLRIKEAYDTLSDPAKRAQYNSLRQRTTKYSERFRLRGREFFDGIKGEQLRRLAVLCLLYRQAAGELPGLTVLDLEQLTGCTREELGAALWYLREMKWARFGEFTEYSITAAGFDVVENKLDDPEAARSRVWLTSQEPRGREFNYSRVREISAPQDFSESPLNMPFTAHIEIEAERPPQENPPEENMEAAPIAPEIVTAEIVTEPAAQNTAPEKDNSPIATASPTDLFQQLLRLQNANEPRDEQLAVPHPPMEQSPIQEGLIQHLAAQIDEPPAPAARSSRFEASAADALAAAPEFDLDIIRARFAPPQSRQSVPAGPQPPVPVSTTPEIRDAPPITERPQPETNRARPRRGLFRRLFGFDDDDEPLIQVVPRARQSPLSDALDMGNISYAIAKPSNEPLAAVQQPVPAAEEIVRLQPDAAAQTESAPVSQPNVPVMPEPLATVTQTEEVPAEPVATAVAGPSNPEARPQSPGVTNMNSSLTTIAQPSATVAAAKRVVFSMGGKGGVGKTSVMAGLAEWYEENRIPVTLLDLDTENKACGSLTHFFGGRVPKINIYTPAGLDTFVDHLGDDNAVILADMGAGAGQITHSWFDTMYPDVADAGVVFTAIGVVTADPASVESVLAWAAALEDRVDYVIVENHLTEHADFAYWQEGEQALEFRRRYRPAIVRLDCRLAELENASRNHGITLGRIATRSARSPELLKASVVMRAQSYRRRMSSEFDKVKELLLP